MAQRDRHHFTPPSDLGRRVQAFGLTLAGTLTEESAIEFADEVARAIGMTPAYEAQCWLFPVEDRGGTGLMVVQPITESFIVVDTWPDFRGVYLFISSCKPFDLAPVYDMARRYRLQPNDQFSSTLELPR